MLIRYVLYSIFMLWIQRNDVYIRRGRGSILRCSPGTIEEDARPVYRETNEKRWNSMKENIVGGFVGVSYVLERIPSKGVGRAGGIDKKKKERRIPSVGTFAPTLYPCLYRERKKERGRFIAILAYCRKPAVVLFSSLCLRNRFYRTFLCIQRNHRPSSFPLHLLRYMTFFFFFFFL